MEENGNFMEEVRNRWYLSAKFIMGVIIVCLVVALILVIRSHNSAEIEASEKVSTALVRKDFDSARELALRMDNNEDLLVEIQSQKVKFAFEQIEKAIAKSDYEEAKMLLNAITWEPISEVKYKKSKGKSEIKRFSNKSETNAYFHTFLKHKERLNNMLPEEYKIDQSTF